jgi:peptidyl-prolyl cis-trans isomerase C
MRTPVYSIILLLATLLPQASQAADTVTATVNGQPVKQAWVDAVRQDAQNAGRKPDDKMILSLLLRNELLAQEATRLGIDKRPEFAAREEIRHRELLATLLINDTLKNTPVSEDMLKAEYENFKKMMGTKEYSVRHIQLQTEAEAKEVIAQLAKGADFIKLAKEKSMDQATRDNGGALGWVTRSAIIPPLRDEITKLQKEKFTTVPIQSRAGWHVLKLRDVRDFQPPVYDKVKEQLRNRLKNQQIAKLVESLRGKAKIEVAK